MGRGKSKKKKNRQFQAARLLAFHAVKPTPECLPHFSTSFIQSSTVYGVLDSVVHSHPRGHGGTGHYDTTLYPAIRGGALASRSSASHNLKRNKFGSSFLIFSENDHGFVVVAVAGNEVLGRGCNQTIGRY